MVAIDRETLLKLIKDKQLVSNLIDPTIQVSPNGIELTLFKIFQFDEPGVIDFSNRERQIPKNKELKPKDGQYTLPEGTYLVTYNESVQIPPDMIAIGRPRSSLLRSGVTIESAVWDAGYKGRSRGLLTVYNPHGVIIKQNARLLHLIFFWLQKETKPYEGAYQGED